MASIEEIKQLREETGVSITECKKALESSKGDFDKAKELLRKKGMELADKRSLKQAGAGIIEGYIHSDSRVGVLLEIRCETDFVAKSPDFKNLAHEICLQIAAMKPLFLSEEDIPEKFLDGEKKIYKEQLKDSGKPEKIVNQVIGGKLKKYKEQVCLIYQPWIKDDSKTIKDLLNDYLVKLGENIIIKRFSRFEI